jgi:hypothetical protein
METKITNITLDKDRFTVFFTVLGNEENITFMPDITAAGIREYILERKTFYQDLLDKQAALQEELLNVEI